MRRATIADAVITLVFSRHFKVADTRQPVGIGRHAALRTTTHQNDEPHHSCN